jgi:hypothetical protein
MISKLTKQINSQFTPTYINGIPQYGFGSWLKKNAGMIGTVVGAGAGALVGMPQIGASIGGSLGGAVQGATEQNALQQQQAEELAKQNAIKASMNMIPTNSYAPVMACGGKIKKANGGPLAFNNSLAIKDNEFQNWYKKNTLEGKNKIPYSEDLNYDYYSFYKNGDYNNSDYNIDNHFPDTYKRPQHPTFSNESIYSTPENPGGEWKGEKFNKKGTFKYAVGGFMTNIGQAPLMGNPKEKGGELDNTSYMKVGGTHEQNGGIPMGNALVERGEYIWEGPKGKYVFSNRF